MISRAREEGGFTLVELLVAMLVLGVGIVATINVFSSSKAASLVAQRYEVAVHQGQRELERLRAFPYDEVGLTAAPNLADRLESDPNKIGYFNGTAFTVKSAGAQPAVSEQLVLPATNAAGTVDPTPDAFQVGGSGISGKVYRYVTWRPESCGTDGSGQELCPGNQDTKRITVAVTVDLKGRPGPARPVWMSSVSIDPTSEPYE